MGMNALEWLLKNWHCPIENLPVMRKPVSAACFIKKKQIKIAVWAFTCLRYVYVALYMSWHWGNQNTAGHWLQSEIEACCNGRSFLKESYSDDQVWQLKISKGSIRLIRSIVIPCPLNSWDKEGVVIDDILYLAFRLHLDSVLLLEYWNLFRK